MEIKDSTGRVYDGRTMVFAGDLYGGSKLIMSHNGNVVARLSVLAQGDGWMKCLMNREFSIMFHFQQNPITGQWWMLRDSDICPTISKTFEVPTRFVVCHKLKYVSLIIPRNGCSSLVSSALYYDNKIDAEFVKQMNEKRHQIWLYKKGDKKLVNAVRVPVTEIEEIENGKYKDYKKFIVVDDERHRYVRWMNRLLSNHYNPQVDYDLSDDKLFDELTWMYQYCNGKGSIYQCDEHAMPIRRYKEIASKTFKDSDFFSREFEEVELKNLRTWFKDNFDAPMIENNVSTPEERKWKWEEFTDEQQAAILRNLSVEVE